MHVLEKLWNIGKETLSLNVTNSYIAECGRQSAKLLSQQAEQTIFKPGSINVHCRCKVLIGLLVVKFAPLVLPTTMPLQLAVSSSHNSVDTGLKRAVFHL